MDTDSEEKERRRKEKVTFPSGGSESTNPENMEALHASIKSWGTEKEDNTLFNPGRELMITGNLLTPPHYQPTLRLCFWRCQASYIPI